MSTFARGRSVLLLIALARLRQSVGWPGVAGLVLLASAAAVWSSAWLEQSRQVDLPLAAAAAVAAPVAAANPASDEGVRLPAASRIPALLNHIEQAAVTQGLGWPRAEYRVNPVSDELPASLELRCVLKGPYPSVRRLVTILMHDIPTLTLREFTLSRPHSQAADVEAKLAIVVYVAADPGRAPSAGESR